VKELGEFLKNERLKKGITLDELQEITKVRIKYLKAIEDGNLDDIPALVYAKGFIKSYAEAVGVDANELLSKYNYLFKEKEEANKIEDVSTYQKAEKNFDTAVFLRKLIKPIIGIIIVAILCYGIYYIVAQINKVVTPVPNTTQTNKSNKNNSNKTTANSVYNQNDFTTALQLVSSTKKDVEYKIINANKTNKVDIFIPGQQCWFSIKADGANVYEGTLYNGMSKSFNIKDNIEILMGNPPDVKITVDGQDIQKISIPAPVTLKIHR
jgi:cytoskeletal protein RodZ